MVTQFSSATTIAVPTEMRRGARWIDVVPTICASRIPLPRSEWNLCTQVVANRRSTAERSRLGQLRKQGFERIEHGWVQLLELAIGQGVQEFDDVAGNLQVLALLLLAEEVSVISLRSHQRFKLLNASTDGSETAGVVSAVFSARARIFVALIAVGA